MERNDFFSQVFDLIADASESQLTDSEQKELYVEMENIMNELGLDFEAMVNN